MEFSLFFKKHIEELEDLKRMSPIEKLDILFELYLMGMRLLEVRDKEKKQKAYDQKDKIGKERLREFIKSRVNEDYF